MKKINPVLISETRKEINKYITKKRLIKVTIFKQWDKYYGTLIFSKKTNVYGYSRLNPSDTKVDKSIGTFYAMWRYLNSLPEITSEEIELRDKIYKVIPPGYKKFVMKPLFRDIYADRIIYCKDNLVSGYNKVNFQVDIVKYESLVINGLEARLSSQNLTNKYYEM